MKYKTTVILSVLMLLASTRVMAASFDYIAPADVYFNQSQLGSGIGSPFWGLLIASNNDLTLEVLQNAVINTSIDNPEISYNQSGGFMNLHIYAPLLLGDVAGYSSSGPVTDSSSLLTYLNAGESLKDANGQIQGQSIQFDDNWLGTANIDYEIIIGDQHVEFTTQLHFVDTLPGDLWVEVTDGRRLSSTAISAVPIPSALWLFISGAISLIGLSRHKSA